MGAGAAIVGVAALSAISSARASSGRRRAARSEQEARLLEAAEARARLALNLQQQKREKVRRRGAVVAAFGASGATLEGTPTDVLIDLATEEGLAESAIRFESAALEQRALRGAEFAGQRARRENPFLSGAISGASAFFGLGGGTTVLGA